MLLPWAVSVSVLPQHAVIKSRSAVCLYVCLPGYSSNRPCVVTMHVCVAEAVVVAAVVGALMLHPQFCQVHCMF
jgi:hypothetical protein